jgi:hypothetical protein
MSMLAFACVGVPSDVVELVEAEGPAILPVEAHLLGLKYDDPEVTRFVGVKLHRPDFTMVSSHIGNRVRGFELTIERGVITVVSLYSGPEHLVDFNQYADPLPGGIHFGDQPKKVRRLLGPPDASGSQRPWDRWDYGTWNLYVLYTRYEGVETVNLRLN